MTRIFPIALALAFSLGCDPAPDQQVPEKEAHDAVHAEAAVAKEAPSSQPAAASAQPGKGEKPSDRDQKDDDGIVRRGPALAADAKILNVEDCTAALDGKTVQVQGTVAQVCAKKGCWFVIEDEKKQQIRITSKGYKFFVPKDAVGKKAVIFGDLRVKEMSVAEAQHMEDDAAESTGKPAKKVTEGSTELRIAALSLELR